MRALTVFTVPRAKFPHFFGLPWKFYDPASTTHALTVNTVPRSKNSQNFALPCKILEIVILRPKNYKHPHATHPHTHPHACTQQIQRLITSISRKIPQNQLAHRLLLRHVSVPAYHKAKGQRQRARSIPAVIQVNRLNDEEVNLLAINVSLTHVLRK